MTSIYLLRHGETEMNQKGCYYGWTDCGLSQTGVEQAQLLRKSLLDREIDIVITSDLKRAKDTGAIICEGKNVETIGDMRLRELHFGAWEGKHYTEIMKQHKENWDLWVQDWENTVPEGGESFVEMYDRVASCLAEVLQKYENKNIMLISHQGCLRAMMTYLLGLPRQKVWSFAFEHGKYSLLELEDGNCTIRHINAI